MLPRLSIVVPCYNEAKNIPLLCERFRTAVGTRADIEVVLVNNGSKDDSAQVFAQELARPENGFLRCVEVTMNQGYGFGILSGLRASRGEYLAWTHADLQTDPVDVLLAFELCLAQARPERTFVRGRRIGRPLFDWLFTAGMGAIASVALGRWLVDVNAQPKLFHRHLLGCLDDAPTDFSLDLFVLYIAGHLGLTIVQQPVHFGLRKHGEAKGGGTLGGKYRLVKRTLAYIFELRKSLRQRTLHLSLPDDAIAPVQVAQRPASGAAVRKPFTAASNGAIHRGVRTSRDSELLPKS
jgi:glycosyltransferase involved in cell wall biosynthesis